LSQAHHPVPLAPQASPPINENVDSRAASYKSGWTEEVRGQVNMVPSGLVADAIRDQSLDCRQRGVIEAGVTSGDGESAVGSPIERISLQPSQLLSHEPLAAPPERGTKVGLLTSWRRWQDKAACGRQRTAEGRDAYAPPAILAACNSDCLRQQGRFSIGFCPRPHTCRQI
jgi:hypothetical protein